MVLLERVGAVLELFSASLFMMRLAINFLDRVRRGGAEMKVKVKR